LPDYMIPAYFIQPDHMPLLSTGKIDRKALARMEGEAVATGTAYAPPSTETEIRLAKIWADLLGMEKTGIDDDFFEVGGDSLKAMSLITRIYKEFDYKIPLARIFQASSIRDIALLLQEEIQKGVRADDDAIYSAVGPVEKREYYPMSTVQTRFFLLSKMENIGTAYNINTLVAVDGPMEGVRMQELFRALIKRHQSLRTSFTIIDGAVVQIVHDKVDFAIEYYDAGSESEDVEKQVDFFIRPFDLSLAPLLRVGIIKRAELRHILMVDMHHIISDGVSIMNLVDEFTGLYRGTVLPPLMLQYKDYAVHQQRQYHAGAMQRQETFWTNWFQGELPILELPADFIRPAVRSFAGGTIEFTIEAQETYALRKLAMETRSSLFMVLMTLYNIFLSRLSGREDIVVGIPVAGRGHPDFEPIIGMFANTLALRFAPEPGKPVEDFLKEIKTASIDAFENQDYPFEDLIEKLGVVRDTGRNPLFDAMLVLQNNEITARKFPSIPSRMEGENENTPGPNETPSHGEGAPSHGEGAPSHGEGAPDAQEQINEGPFEFTVSPYHYQHNTAKFDLTLEVFEVGERLVMELEYSGEIFKDSTAFRFTHHLHTLIRSFGADGALNMRLRDLEILPEEEKRLLLLEFNDTDSPYPENETLQYLFERQAALNPFKTAVVSPDPEPVIQTDGPVIQADGPGIQGDAGILQNRVGTIHVTYDFLNREVNRLAHYLRTTYNSGPGKIIGISIDRSIEMVVIILGIMKSGAAYVAIDPNYPKDRVLHMLEDSRSDLVIIDKNRPGLFGDYRGEILNYYSIIADLALQPSIDPAPLNSPDDILYVIYTSGTTGMPNGAMLSHGNLGNLVNWQRYDSGIDCSLRCLQFTSINFCVSFQETITTLTSGGQLHLIGEVVRQDIDYLMNFLTRRRIENLYLPFSYLNFLFNESDHWADGYRNYLKHIITAGEQLKVTSGLKSFLNVNLGVQLHNHYGSSEMHVVTAFTLDAAVAERTPVPPAGMPIGNTRIFILDEKCSAEEAHHVPIGVWGELYVSGSYETSGYIHNPELSDGKLFHRPDLPAGGKRLYRSGDLGRRLEDGNIELRGRKDSQVKIRGFRVEPAEIESKILFLDNVTDCVVVVRDISESGAATSVQKELVAYVVLTGGDVGGVRENLTAYLPPYMLPRMMQLEKLPLMPNGKVDRAQLPEPDPDTQSGSQYIAPTSEVEHILVDLWSRILAVAKNNIGIMHDFFELGGHSLKATMVQAGIHDALNVRVPLAEIFKNPTVGALARVVGSTRAEMVLSIEPVEEREYYPLSSAQRRLYLTWRLDPEGIAYNMPIVVTLKGKFDISSFPSVVEALILRHESFRTSFLMLEETLHAPRHMGGDFHKMEMGPIQRIRKWVPFEIEYYDLSPDIGNESREQVLQSAGGESVPHQLISRPTAGRSREGIIRDFIRPFQLSSAPLLRVAVLKEEEESYIFAVDMHHIVSD
ncbi:MAG: amino acid adenylation domain-containing protein, partial [bacterium]|nr:amino acid adenylation domain-containing protein [bacterium]